MIDARPNAHRRFLRISLRAMLLLVLVIGGVLGWTLHKVREQGIAVAALEKLGCTESATYANNKPPTILERLRIWCGEKQYRNVVIFGADNSQLTDAGLVHIERLTQLEGLNLDQSQVTDAGLPHLGQLTQLTVLGLKNTQITDAGLVHLKRLAQLQLLELNDTQVTDAGLVHLERLSQLKWLDLTGTQVTEAGVGKLQEALPSLDIDW